MCLVDAILVDMESVTRLAGQMDGNDKSGVDGPDSLPSRIPTQISIQVVARSENAGLGVTIVRAT
jgi:hypothetical protein